MKQTIPRLVRAVLHRIRRFPHRLRDAVSVGQAALRLLPYRMHGARIAPTALLGPRVRLTGEIAVGQHSKIEADAILDGNIEIGDRTVIQRGVELRGNIKIGCDTVVGAHTLISTLPGASIRVGNDVLINRFSLVGASQRVAIDDHCIFAAYVHITDATHRIDDPSILTKHAAFATAPVMICANVWLGSGVMVTMGVTIGEGTVVGAKSLVNRDLPAGAVAYGVPASVRRYREVGEK